MANGNGTLSWQQLLAKHGPWALGCAVMGFVIYTFVLMPSAHEREAFIETSVQNAESMDIVADSTRDIRDSVERQEVTMKRLGEEVENQSVLRTQAMDTMDAFAKEVRGDHPLQQEILQKNQESIEKILKHLETKEP